MISITMLSKNCEKTIGDALAALSWADEIILLDTGSSDQTLEIARTFHNVAIHKTPFTGFGELHNRATTLARNDWILSIDSDEIVTPELAHEIQNLDLEPTRIYSIARKNYFNGRWIRACGWHPDRVNRLYNRKSAQFSAHRVHESLITKGMDVVKLKSYLEHTSYTGVNDMLEKMRLYADLWAHQYRHKRRSSLLRALLHHMTTFFTSYFIHRGLFFSREGFIISKYKADTAYQKYLRLIELNAHHDSAGHRPAFNSIRKI